MTVAGATIHGRQVAVFLFAHQDDEFGVFQAIDNCCRQGLRVICIFFTTSVGRTGLAATRDEESRRVLRSLGVGEQDILFTGTRLGIDDGSLPSQLDAASSWLTHYLSTLDHIALLCIPCWEGGHHDHDSLHAMSVHLAERLALLGVTRQYALYNALGRRWPFLNVLSPLDANGPVETHPISWRNRMRFLKLCLSYPSQLQVWSGLFPMVLLHYLSQGVQTLQPVSPSRPFERPHAGQLQYERKGFFSWAEMQLRLVAWRSRSEQNLDRKTLPER
jgi:LmbE family N-acetylglucosaminyl deacetylase